MSKYIDADIIPYYPAVGDRFAIEGAMIAYKTQIDKLPAADVFPVVHGHWQERQTVSGYTYECSICKGHITYDEHGEEVFSDFCPYCSAILDEEVNEEDTGVKNEYLKLSPKKAESEDINNER